MHDPNPAEISPEATDISPEAVAEEIQQAMERAWDYATRLRVTARHEASVLGSLLDQDVELVREHPSVA